MIESLLKRATSQGLRRGMSGSRGWMVVGIVAVGARSLRRLANPKSEVLYRTRVQPGDRFEITTRVPQ